MSLPCADTELEMLYIRSCIGVSMAAQTRHLADEQLRLKPTDCSIDAHCAILAALYARVDARQTVWHQDIRDAVAGFPGGAMALSALDRILVDNGPTERAPGPLAKELRQLARRRRKYIALQRAAASLANGEEEAADEHLMALSAEAQESSAGEFMTAAETISVACAQAREPRGSDHRRTGFQHIDEAIGYLRAQTMTTVGGTTGSGKTSVMLAMAVKQCQRQMKVGVVSVEDAAPVFGPRVLAHMVDLNPSVFDREWDPKHDHMVARGWKAASDLGLHFAFELNKPLGDVLRAVRYLVRKHGCEIIYVDYLQAIADGGAKDRRLFVSNAAARIKGQCQELGVTLVLGSQLSRPAKDKPFGEVFLGDLKESGDLENMSEVVMLLWKTGDDDDARTLGKVAKVKWSPGRPRFEVGRDPVTGSVVSLHKHVPPPTPALVDPRARFGAGR